MPAFKINTVEEAVAFARNLVNSENTKFRKIGRMMLALKDENILRAVQMAEVLCSQS